MLLDLVTACSHPLVELHDREVLTSSSKTNDVIFIIEKEKMLLYGGAASHEVPSGGPTEVENSEKTS